MPASDAPVVPRGLAVHRRVRLRSMGFVHSMTTEAYRVELFVSQAGRTSSRNIIAAPTARFVFATAGCRPAHTLKEGPSAVGRGMDRVNRERV